jgi:pyruvate formate lyase activating enzyme
MTVGKEAQLYEQVPGGRVRCTACARYCNIPEGKIGLCGIRGNVGGKLWLFVYGKIIAGHIDPIEKKPVTHYMPGTKIFSVATTGCNWLCHYCFTPETSVFTNHGVKTFQQLYGQGHNEQITGLNGQRDLKGIKALTHRGRFQPVKQVFKHFYHGPMLTIKPWYLPAIRSTPDHKILTTSNPEWETRKVQARFITKKNYVVIPKIKEQKGSSTVDLESFLKTLKLPKYKKIRSNRQWRLDYSTLNKISRLTAKGLTSREIGRIVDLSPVTVRRARSRLARSSASELSNQYRPYRVVVSKDRIKLSNGKTSVPRFIKLNEGLAKLLGYYCADGSTSKNQNRPNSFTVSFSFCKDEKSNINDVRRLIKRVFGLDSYIVTQGSTTHVYLSNSILGHLFRELCGMDCYTKKVPDIVLTSAEKKVIKAFLNGYLAGDGYITPENRSIHQSYLGANSVSQILSLGVALLFIKIGSVPRLYVGENNPVTVVEGRTVSRHNDYLLKVLKKNGGSRNNTLGWQDIRGLVIERRDNYLVPVKSVTTEEYSGFVYNMEVDVDHTYVANTIAVSNCQNFDISQRRKIEGMDVTPEKVVEMTKRYGCQGLAYTYNEPSIFIEFAHDIGVQARKEGLINIFVSNGYDTPQTVGLMQDFLDCITVDFKGSGETSFVRKYIGIANADPIFQTLLDIRDRTKVHIEITDLIVPEIGDDLGAAKKLSSWVYDNLGPDTPIHFLRFHPDYKLMHLPATPVATLEKHYAVAKEVGLNYVYLGNVPGHPLEHTYCAGCGKVVVERIGFDITGWHLDDQNRCKYCGNEIPIVGQLSKTVNEERFMPVIM